MAKKNPRTSYSGQDGLLGARYALLPHIKNGQSSRSDNIQTLDNREHRKTHKSKMLSKPHGQEI